MGAAASSSALLAGQQSTTDTSLILSAIEKSKASLLVHIGHLAKKGNLIRNDLDKIRGHLTELETRVLAMEDHTGQHVDMIAELQHTVKLLVRKADDAENRMCCNNVRVLNIPDWAEEDHPADFAEAFFKDLLNLPEVPAMYIAECANQVPVS